MSILVYALYLTENRLNQKLIEQGRFDDLTKAVSDSVYQKKLLKEFKI